MRLYGFEAIEYAEKEGLPLNKLADPINEEATGLTIAEAEAIAADDEHLIWLEVSGTDYYDKHSNLEPLR